MSGTDYGKEAYLKVEELMKRIKALEAENSGEEREIDLSFDIFINGSVEKTVDFYSYEEGEGGIYVEIPSDAQLYLNGTILPSVDGVVEGVFPFKKGKNSIRSVFAQSVGENVSCIIKVSGKVEDRLIGRLLCPVGGDYYSYSDGDYYAVYKIGENSPALTLYGVGYASARYEDGEIVVAFTDEVGNMTIRRYDLIGRYTSRSVSGNNYGKFAIRTEGERIYLYGIKGNYLWAGFIGDNGSIVDSKTGLRAKEVAFGNFGAAAKGLLVTDVDGNIGACVLSSVDPLTVSSRIGVGIKNNADFYNDGISYSKDGSAFLLLFRGNKFSAAGEICVADEAIKTESGRTVVRKGRKIQIL